MKQTKIILVFFLLFLLNPGLIQAKKTLPTGTKTVFSAANVIISPKLRSDRLALIIDFGSLLKASSVSYTLSYDTNGTPQGVLGTIRPTTQTDQRVILFGTCSSGTCRYHKSLANMRLVITTTLVSGAKISKSYRVKP